MSKLRFFLGVSWLSLSVLMTSFASAGDHKSSLRRMDQEAHAAGEFRLFDGQSSVPTWRMLRFWRGYKQDTVSRTEFESNVNARLIPETVEVGGGGGLNAYLPSFYAEEKPDFLPDEVAIVDYTSEEKYNSIRNTERGKKYGPLHFEPGLFTKQNARGFKSGSLVALNYTGWVEIQPEGRAYILGDPNLNWQRGLSLRRTVLPLNNWSASEAQRYLNEFVQRFDELGVQGVVAIIDPHYVILMINLSDQRRAKSLNFALEQMEQGQFRKIDEIYFERQQHGHTHLAPASGINVVFAASGP